VSNVDWYAARAAGVVAYALVTSGVLVGVVLSGRAKLERWPAFAVADVHRFVGLLAATFVAIHVVAIWLDSVVHFSLVQLVVPGAAGYRPFWVALGTVSAELLVAVGVTNALKKRLGFARWKRWHYLTFVLWALSTAHGIGVGSDATERWLRALYVGSVASVAAAAVWRLGRGATAAAARG
jgi:sulfoxide reductase heme-binding subunit YedZ